MQLSDEEVQQLCRKLISRQLMAYQSGAAQKEIERKLTEESRDFAISDSSESKIQFFPHAIRLANSARIEPVGSRSHRFRDVSTYARFFPGNRAAVNMMEVEKMLWSMVNSSSLSRITQ